MKRLTTFLFVIFATLLMSGCSTPMTQKANMAYRAICGIANLIGFRGDSNADVDGDDDCSLKESGCCHEDITR